MVVFELQADTRYAHSPSNRTSGGYQACKPLKKGCGEHEKIDRRFHHIVDIKLIASREALIRELATMVMLGLKGSQLYTALLTQIISVILRDYAHSCSVQPYRLSISLPKERPYNSLRRIVICFPHNPMRRNLIVGSAYGQNNRAGIIIHIMSL